MNSPSSFAAIQAIQEEQREGWTPETITPTAMNTTDQTYHTPNVVQQRREEAATINAAMNPAPAGKLTDEQLGGIGAKVASEMILSHPNKLCQSAFLFVTNGGMYEYGYNEHAAARTAFARAVREAVEAKQADEIVRLAAILDQAIEMVNTPGTTKDNLPKAINAKIMQRDEFHDATLKRLDDAKTEISRIKAEYESLLKVYKNADEGARNMHNELKRLQSASRMCTADMDALKDQLAKANAELEQRRKVMADIVRELGHGLSGLAHHEIQPVVASLRERNHELNELLAKVDAELERLRWRPVSVKPTREDADASGNVEAITPKGRILLRMFSSWPWELNRTTAHEVSHWRPFCLPAPTAEEKERAEFEKSYRKAYPDADADIFSRQEDGYYFNLFVNGMWKLWKDFSASQEVKA